MSKNDCDSSRGFFRWARTLALCVSPLALFQLSAADVDCELDGPAGCGSGSTNCVHTATVTCRPSGLTCWVVYDVTCEANGGETGCSNAASRLKTGTDEVGGCCGCFIAPAPGKTWGTVSSCDDLVMDCN